MIDPRTTPLGHAFIEDHRHLMRGLLRLKRALQRDDLREARRIGEELDRVAGPHIRFEEEVFYPEVVRSRGGEYTDQLYEEHRIGRRLLERLRDYKDTDRLEPAEQASLVEQSQATLNHTISCGTLLSSITTLDESRQEELLAMLLDLRRRPTRWTELSGPRAPAATARGPEEGGR